MMRGIRRLAVCTAAIALLAGGAAVAVSVQEAHAQSQEVDSCDGASDSTVPYQCTMSDTIPSTSGITVTVTDDSGTNNEDVTVDVTTLSCTYNSTTDTEAASEETGDTPLTDNVSPLPLTAETGTCDVVVTTSTPTTNSSGAAITPDEFTAELFYTPVVTATASATATTSTVELVKGYSGMCLDDKGNSSSNGAKIIVWDCNSSDQAQSWNWTSNELRHNGKCINDTGDGGSGTHLILYTCGSAKNDKWTKSNGELKLQAHNGKLCLDDTGYSKKDGTQLIVYTCKDQSNEKWTVSS
jgi:hypothetical protein